MTEFEEKLDGNLECEWIKRNQHWIFCIFVPILLLIKCSPGPSFCALQFPQPPGINYFAFWKKKKTIFREENKKRKVEILEGIGNEKIKKYIFKNFLVQFLMHKAEKKKKKLYLKIFFKKRIRKVRMAFCLKLLFYLLKLNEKRQKMAAYFIFLVNEANQKI